MAEMSLTWTLRNHGWAVCSVADQQSEAEAVASYVTSGPEQFLTAVGSIVSGSTDARAELEAEPTAFRWIFQRRGSYVEIRLLELSSTRLPDDAGTVVWASRQSIDTLARVVVRTFDAVVANHGEDGYEVTWGRPFPRSELEALRAAWHRAKRPDHAR